MAHPRKKSRPIAVGSTDYRWRLTVNDDYPWVKNVAVYDGNTANGAEIQFVTDAPSVTPGIIRRIIEAGLRRGFDPADRSTSVHLPPQEVLEAVYSYAHPLRVGSEHYLWTPVFKGGPHLWIRSAAAPRGQLLATMTDLKVEHLTDRLASAFISLALRSGWQPLHSGLDCHWLDHASCRRILEELFPAPGTTPPHSHTAAPSPNNQ